jgi:hypothetical protein
MFLLDEPMLTFAHSQSLADPRDGLTLFGPLDPSKVYGIRAGVVGTVRGREIFKGWLSTIHNPILSDLERPDDAIFRPFFPGFQSAFRIPWNTTPQAEVDIDAERLKEALRHKDRHQRVFATVNLYEQAIVKAQTEGDSNAVDLWFVVVPPAIKKFCSPKSAADPDAQESADMFTAKEARAERKQPSLFGPAKKNISAFDYEPHFHNQLKARLLRKAPPLQIVQEDTLAPNSFLGPLGRPLRRVDQASTIAWNLCTTAYYKATGRPWKLASVRDRVCYLGLVFKKEERSFDSRNACCAAQMFLDSGDGVVFKGAVGPWYSPDSGFHLSKEGAKQVLERALDSYKTVRQKDGVPKEIFIHGRTSLSNEEWAGFTEGAGRQTNVVYVKIHQVGLKVFGRRRYPLPRGMMRKLSDYAALLWTIGYVPRLQTYIGKEVPSPYLISIERGRAGILTVASDVLSLTKLNFNTCIFGDGRPVTLRFADEVGEILTAAPLDESEGKLPLHFRFYI